MTTVILCGLWQSIILPPSLEAGVTETAQAARAPSAFHPQVLNAFLTIEHLTNIKYLRSSQRTQIVLPENQNLPLIAEISMYDIQAFNADRFKRDQFSIEVLAVVGQVGPSPIHVQENHQFQLPTQSIFEAPKVNFPS